MASQARKSPVSELELGPQSWRLSRRLDPSVAREIAVKYEAGEMTPALCTQYGLSKSGILRLLRDQGIALRRQPLTDKQVAIAKQFYAEKQPISTIAEHLDTSYNNVRQRLIKAGVQLRPRGGSYR